MLEKRRAKGEAILGVLKQVEGLRADAPLRGQRSALGEHIGRMTVAILVRESLKIKNSTQSNGNRLGGQILKIKF